MDCWVAFFLFSPSFACWTNHHFVLHYLYLFVCASFQSATGYNSCADKIKRLSQKIRWENSLKACFQVLEQSNFEVESFPQSQLARREEEKVLRQPKGGGCPHSPRYPPEFISLNTIQRTAFRTDNLPTPSGWEVACRMIRNHRLWELYLTQEASYASDHVHDDAEKIEHIIGEKTVRRLERILSNPRLDPRKPIPSQSDIDRGWIFSTQEEPV